MFNLIHLLYFHSTLNNNFPVKFIINEIPVKFIEIFHDDVLNWQFLYHLNLGP
jgi:hypothetical protein